MKKLFYFFTTAIFLFFSITYSAENKVQDYVSNLLNEAFDVLNSPSSTDVKKQKIEEILKNSLDFNSMASSVLGRAQLDNPTKSLQEFKPVYSKYVLSTYGQALAGYNGQKINIKSIQDIDDKTYQVRTQIITQGEGEPFNVDCIVQKFPDGFKIIDIVTEGVSLISTHKTEFKSILSNQGFSGLIAELKSKSN